MTPAFTIKTGLALTLLATAPAFTQTQSTSATTETTTPAPATYVYVQTSSGIHAYNASTAGQLTLVKGSPFAVTGTIAASTASHFITLGEDNIHVYPLESGGALGKQISQISSQEYGGSKCGTLGNGSILDHAGKYFSVQLWGSSSAECSAWQTYKLASNGEMTFLGDSESTAGYHGDAFSIGISTVSSNDTFSYGVIGEVYANSYSAFTRESSGALTADNNFTETDPTPEPSENSNYFPMDIAADPASHLAVLMYYAFASSPPPPQLASYTINDTTGAIKSTNTYANMPTPTVENAWGISMSPSGLLVAVVGTAGMQIFHFNGANPPTKYSGVLLPSVDISHLAWDKNNHLYAISYATGELYVYTVTPTSISEAAGSPYKVASPKTITGPLVVVNIQ